MDTKMNFEILECPLCGGVGILEEEHGWSVNISCWDCGCQTADTYYKKAEDRETAILQAVELWNLGKVVAIDNGC